MALQIQKNNNNVGVPAPVAYARIAVFTYDLVANSVAVAVNIYFNAAARQDGKGPIDGGTYSGTPGVDMPNLNGNNQGIGSTLYGWLKTLPDFTGAIDV